MAELLHRAEVEAEAVSAEMIETIEISEISDLLGRAEAKEVDYHCHLLRLLHPEVIGTGLLEVEADRGDRHVAGTVAVKRRKPAGQRLELAYRCCGRSRQQNQGTGKVPDTEANTWSLS
mmetsp:Transcript_90957/g.161897  ORF Transcript_90957/g.161897 Transcript_90957/m.161897 type:complete len:119 (-) Transcript_90957:38-394(-)